MNFTCRTCKMIKRIISISLCFVFSAIVPFNVDAEDDFPYLADTSDYKNSPSLISHPSLSEDAPDKISLDVKGMDIVDVLKVLATRAGINIVIGRNVTGRVTLFLKNVKVSDAFEIVILANELAYEKKGEIMNIMTAREYELFYGESFADKKQLLNIELKYANAAALAQPLNQIRSSIGRIIVNEPTNTIIIMDTADKLEEMSEMIAHFDRPLQTKVFNLKYAQADKLLTKVQESITKVGGSIKIDERTNKIAVTDYPEKIKELDTIISAFDEKTPQVLIDAQIVEISPQKDEFAMGVDWNYWLDKNVRLISALPAPALTSAATIGHNLAFGVAAADQAAPVSGQRQYKSILDALRVIGETKILSSPRIMVLNNQEAKILVGTKDAYITSTTSQGGTGTTVTSQTVNFVDVGIKLYVTPTINRDRFITIKVRPEISSSTRTSITSQGQQTQIPIVTTSETETTIMIKDGTTIIIAGLKKDKREKEVKKIPLIGDIPLIGFLFRNTKDETNKTELVIFITPHIVSGEDSLDYTSLTNDRTIAYLQAMADIKQKDKAANICSVSPAEYNKTLSEKIRANFTELRKKNKYLRGKSVVSFILNQRGCLAEEPRVISTNNSELSVLAIESIKSASPFPPISADKKKEAFKISLSYE